MNKKGFTLVELLAVIVILGIIITIFVPSVINLINENSTKIYANKEKILKNAAEDYVMSNSSFVLPDGTNPEKYISMNTLISSNMMSSVLDNKTTTECVGFVKITVNSTYGYDYDPCLICDNYSTNKTFCTTATYNSL